MYPSRVNSVERHCLACSVVSLVVTWLCWMQLCAALGSSVSKWFGHCYTIMLSRQLWSASWMMFMAVPRALLFIHILSSQSLCLKFWSEKDSLVQLTDWFCCLLSGQAHPDLYHFCLTRTTADTTSSEFSLYKSFWWMSLSVRELNQSLWLTGTAETLPMYFGK